MLNDDNGKIHGSASISRIFSAFGDDARSFEFAIQVDDQGIYAVRPTGELLWYQYKSDLNLWASNSASQIGYGWAGFIHVFSGGDGIIYAIKPTGELLWYQDTLRNGTNGAQEGGHQTERLSGQGSRIR